MIEGELPTDDDLREWWGEARARGSDLGEARWRRRYFLLRGWARALVHDAGLRERQAKIMRRRPEGLQAIAVAQDPWALRYQRLEFRRQRAHYAVGAYGLFGGGYVDVAGYHAYTAEELAEANRASFAKLRERAFRAKRLLEGEGVDDAINAARADEAVVDEAARVQRG